VISSPFAQLLVNVPPAGMPALPGSHSVASHGSWDGPGHRMCLACVTSPQGPGEQVPTLCPPCFPCQPIELSHTITSGFVEPACWTHIHRWYRPCDRPHCEMTHDHFTVVSSWVYLWVPLSRLSRSHDHRARHPACATREPSIICQSFHNSSQVVSQKRRKKIKCFSLSSVTPKHRASWCGLRKLVKLLLRGKDS
jgi:hypothetical protein